MAKNRHGGAAREAAKRERSKEARVARVLTAEEETTDEIFARLRSGAANVAGVTYQTGVASLLLAGSRSSEALPRVNAVRPEGFEDIDCRLTDGSWVLVQSKQRSAGRSLSRREIAEIIAHAAQVEVARDYDGSVSGFAIVSNADFALAPTGWGSTLGRHEAELIVALQDVLRASGRDADKAADLVGRTHLVTVAGPIEARIESQLIDSYGVAPAISVVARAQLGAVIANVSSSQRGIAASTAQVITANDLDALVSEVRQTVDVEALEEAIRDGVCEPVNFERGTPDSDERFYAGVRVVPGHIGSNRDVVRVPESEAVLRALDSTGHALIVGPSGTGKSGLLWRSASMLAGSAIMVRVLRLESDSDVEGLLRYVRLLAPSVQRRVLICIDDLGRSTTEFWPRARDRLLELAGVLILGACRQEDLLPSVAIGAALVDSKLSRESAQKIYARMQALGIRLHVEPEEAAQRANGLLMEFVAIATTGRRLREVLRSQLALLEESTDSIARDLLAIVTSLHTLGRSVAADDLPELVGAPAAVVARNLTRLRDEHLVVTEDGVAWRGLHDLRAEVILEILHETPPPTLGATYALALSAAPESARPTLYRRAGNRILRSSGLDVLGDPATRLAAAHQSLKPLLDSIVRQVDTLVAADATSAAESIAALVDAAERLDVAAYAASTLDYIQQQTPTTVDVSMYYTMAYASRFTGLFRGLEMFRRIVEVGAGLPPWVDSGRRAVVDRLSDDVIARVLADADLDTAIRFCERLEGFRNLPARLAGDVYASHLSAFAAVGSLDQADLLAQLVATLVATSGLEGPAVADTFGPIQQRAKWAVEADDSGFDVNVAFADRASLPSASGVLVREATFGRDSFCEVSARAFARFSTDDVTRGYLPQQGGDPSTVNSQAVFLAQRLFDACPEADVVTVEVVFPSLVTELNGTPTDGYKRMRHGAVQRRVSTERSIAVQVAVIELLSSERWTERCRQQAAVCVELVWLLEELPSRLANSDSTRGRRDWIARAEAAAAAVARLPGLPFDREMIEDLSDRFPHAADFDQRLRAAMEDPARKALDLIAGCLLQVANNFADDSNLGGAGTRLAGALKLLSDARTRSSLPEFAGVGELLPRELDRLTPLVARTLIALGRGLLARDRIPAKSFERLQSMTSVLAKDAVETSLQALRTRLAEVGVSIDDSAVTLALESADPLLYLEGVAVVDSSGWDLAEQSMRNWSRAEREAAGFTTRMRVVASFEDLLLHIGLVIWGAIGKIHPIAPEEYVEIADALGARQLPYVYQDRADALLRSLTSASAAKVRATSRPADWRAITGAVELPIPDVGPEDPPAWLDAIDAYKVLRDQVLAQQAGEESLAAFLVRVDLADASSLESALLEPVVRLRAAALEADRSAFAAGGSPG